MVISFNRMETRVMNIEFIIPSYNRPHHLMCCVSSIMAQTVPNWKIHIIGDGSDEGIFDKVLQYCNGDDRVKFTNLPMRYNDWGFTPRNIGVEQATEEWVVTTGEDNYYVCSFVEEFLSVVNEDTKFVYSDMIHNNFLYRYFDCQPVLTKIDVGCFMVKTELGKQMKYRTDDYGADGMYVEEYINKFCQEFNNVRKISQALYVHN